RDTVKDLILSQEWLPIMMEHFGAEPEATVAACVRKVESCDLLILLVAHRRGWVPSRAQGGDDMRSATVFELDAARRSNIPVRAILANEHWPGSLWEESESGRQWVREFRTSLDHIAVFFSA